MLGISSIHCTMQQHGGPEPSGAIAISMCYLALLLVLMNNTGYLFSIQTTIFSCVHWFSIPMGCGCGEMHAQQRLSNLAWKTGMTILWVVADGRWAAWGYHWQLPSKWLRWRARLRVIQKEGMEKPIWTVTVVVAHLAALTFLLTVKDLWTSLQWVWSHAILLPSFPWAFPFLRVCCQHSPKKMSFFDTPKWCQSAKEIGILWGCRHVGGSWGSPAGRRAGKRLTTELGRRGHWAKVVIVSCLDVLAKSCREASQSWEVPRWFLQL